MEIVNATPMLVNYTLGMDPEGRERVVVVVKGTFQLPKDGGALKLADEQAEPILADESYGEPGMSAVKYESEFAAVKPRCDVLVNGSAYTPRGVPAHRVTVGLRSPTFEKTFDVVGAREWDHILFSDAITDPVPFTQLPLHYGVAYGGSDPIPGREGELDTFAENPVGQGYYPRRSGFDIIGLPLPNTEETGRPVADRGGAYRPMAFSTLSRNIPQRIAHAGTYNQDWIDNHFPFLPRDFNPLYYQCAPPDQQIDHPRGGEPFGLFNLTPEGWTTFQLPSLDLAIEFTNAAYQRTEVPAVVDTVVIEPDLQRVLLLWRASYPLKRNMLEMRQAVVGRMPRGWYRARDLGKTYYSSLGRLVQSKEAERGNDEVTA